jgi:hypothetical protein
VTLPFAVTGAAMLAAVTAIAYAVWRRQPDTSELLRWLALSLAVVSLVNKQAFYNQFWLVAALVAASLALPQGGSANNGRLHMSSTRVNRRGPPGVPASLG